MREARAAARGVDRPSPKEENTTKATCVRLEHRMVRTCEAPHEQPTPSGVAENSGGSEKENSRRRYGEDYEAGVIDLRNVVHCWEKLCLLEENITQETGTEKKRQRQG